MADCELLAGCIFFNDKMKASQAIANLYKQKYCKVDNTTCARYAVFKKLGRPAVPADLFPNMMDRARAIISGK
jgi:hypothetical protein